MFRNILEAKHFFLQEPTTTTFLNNVIFKSNHEITHLLNPETKIIDAVRCIILPIWPSDLFDKMGQAIVKLSRGVTE